MWMGIKPWIPKKYSKNEKKQRPTKNQKNTKTEIWAKWESYFYIQLARGVAICVSVPVSYAT